MRRGEWHRRLRRVGSGAWTAIPLLLAVGVLLGAGGAVVATFTVEGDWPASGAFVAVLSGVALGVVEGGRVLAVVVNRLRGRGEGGWLSLAGWLAETPLVAVELGYVGVVAFIVNEADAATGGAGLGMSLVLFSVLSLLAAVPLAVLVVGRVAYGVLT